MKYLFLLLLLAGGLSDLLAQTNVSYISQSTNSDSCSAIVIAPRTFPTSTMVKIKSKRISEGLKSTLKNIGYLGWEKGQLYFDESTRDYALLFSVNPSVSGRSKHNSVISESSATSPQTWYFFTYEGRQFTY